MPKTTQLFRYLSDTEQESVVGGQIFPMLGLFSEGKLFFQQTDLETEGKNDLKLASGDSTSQTSKYKLSQITMAFSFTFGLLTIISSGDRLSNFLTKLLN
ncbi:hypothetical protein [Dolichospermum sp. UHCC 0259]|uniref:hypothetical protein n=1 Tax=Dolichospermum sp. UHCC 0259 TaxID=2590010 RepID=UPI0014475920|nr:hypothetical protein [Dolichospermum sp. UHCC 0259]MTJ47804.1 hypothetical protein [Dolichospermum sp. UHCC 0259]